jgi:hypothetical protein
MLPPSGTGRTPNIHTIDGARAQAIQKKSRPPASWKRSSLTISESFQQS